MNTKSILFDDLSHGELMRYIRKYVFLASKID